MRLFLFLVLFVSLVQCQFDYDSVTVDDLLDEDVPDFILYDVSQVEVDTDGSRKTLQAAVAEDYRGLEESRFQDLNFQEWDAEGTLLREGHCDRGILKDSNDADLSGNIWIYSPADGVRITAGSMKWEDSMKTLITESDIPVVLEKDDGSRIEGLGFHADFMEKIITFDKAVIGTLVFDDESEEADSEQGN